MHAKLYYITMDWSQSSQEKFKNAPSEALETEEFINLYNEAPPSFISLPKVSKALMVLMDLMIVVEPVE